MQLLLKIKETQERNQYARTADPAASQMGKRHDASTPSPDPFVRLGVLAFNPPGSAPGFSRRAPGLAGQARQPLGVGGLAGEILDAAVDAIAPVGGVHRARHVD